MKTTIYYKESTSTIEDVIKHLTDCDENFIPRLSQRVSLSEYGNKLVTNAIRFEAWSKKELVGLVAIYCNAADNQSAHVSNVSVKKSYSGMGIASKLLENGIVYAKTIGFSYINLEVNQNNQPAIQLYEKCKFISMHTGNQSITMALNLKNELN